MNLRRVTEEVFVADQPIVRLGESDIAFLKRQALSNARQRARICAHTANEDTLHEMIIGMSKSCYIRPHKHLGKSESFHVVEGEVDVVIVSDEGSVQDVIELGDRGSGRSFYYRLKQSLFHTLLIRTDFLVLHEITNGPFDRDRTIQAPFAPAEDDVEAARDYLSHLASAAAAHRKRSVRHG